MEKEGVVNKLIKDLTDKSLKKEDSDDSSKQEKKLKKNQSVEKLIKVRDAHLEGVPSLEISIKEKAFKALKNAGDDLKREIAAHLEKEIAKDTLNKAVAAETLVKERSTDILKKAGDEFKRQIASDVLRKVEAADILDKARAADTLEKASSTGIKEKAKAIVVLKKVSDELRKETETEIDNMKTADAGNFLKKANMADTLLEAAELLNKMMNNQKQKKIATEILKKARDMDSQEKKRVSVSLDIALEELKKAANEIKREMTGKKAMKEIETEDTTRKEDQMETDARKVDALKKLKDVKPDDEDSRKEKVIKVLEKDAKEVDASKKSKDVKPDDEDSRKSYQSFRKRC
jgi:hypothetical protein